MTTNTDEKQMFALQDEHVLAYLREHPDFFERHPGILASLKLSSAHGGRAISLQERQMEVMREKHKGLESKLAELVHIARDNDAIVEKMHAWTRSLLLTRESKELPTAILSHIQSSFSVPQVAIRLWGVKTEFTHLDFAQGVPVETISLANSMAQPYCGMNSDFQAATWLINKGQDARSIALLPLRRGADPKAFGFLVLGSPDADRFKANMHTAYLSRIGETASASLSHMIE